MAEKVEDELKTERTKERRRLAICAPFFNSSTFEIVLFNNERRSQFESALLKFMGFVNFMCEMNEFSLDVYRPLEGWRKMPQNDKKKLKKVKTINVGIDQANRTKKRIEMHPR